MQKLEVGDKISEFSLSNQEGAVVNMRDYLGKPIVIFFYPKDDTPGCTREACAFRDDFDKFRNVEASVFGISEDSIDAHKRFQKRYDLPFDLLSDVNNRIRKQFGVRGTFFGLIPGRVTYVIDQKGIIRHIYESQLNFEQHVSKAIEILQSIEPKATLAS